ncbi:hypothetical protein [Nocardia macrotermitis]|nr:hypothetical protein [Nocardia macrotermitis]
MFHTDYIRLVRLDLLSETDAAEVAGILAERGYTTVSLGPKPVTHQVGTFDMTDDSRGIRVIGLDEGPYPSDDREWWTGIERRFIDTLARGFGATVSGLTAHRSGLSEMRSELVTATGTIVIDRDRDEAATARLAAFAEFPERAPEPRTTHELGDMSAADGPNFAAVELIGLDDIPWDTLEHAYGSAEEVPGILRDLAADDEGFDDTVQEGLYSAIIHQGTCYSATPLAVPYLAELAAAPDFTPAYRLTLLSALVGIGALELPGEHGPAERSAAAMARVVPRVLLSWAASPEHIRPWLIVLAAFAPADAVELLPEFDEFRRAVPGPSPALDLAIALAVGDRDAVDAIVREASTWSGRIADIMAYDAAPLLRHYRVLEVLANRELAR